MVDLDSPAHKAGLKVGDLVTINYGYHPGKPAVVTYVNPPDIRFVYPDGKEGSSGVRGVKLVSKK